MNRRDALLALLRENVPALPPDVADNTSLIRSGIVDSAGLFHLALWIEQQVGNGIDLTRFDLAAEWDTMAAMLSFVERERAHRPSK